MRACTPRLTRRSRFDTFERTRGTSPSLKFAVPVGVVYAMPMNACPECKAEIPPDEINVAKDVALCRSCNKAFALSSLVHGANIPGSVDLAAPPPGAWYRDDGVEVVIGATTRSAATGFFFTLFATFWNGITWTVLLGTLTGLIKPSNSSGQSQSPVFIALFLVPFVLIGIGTALAAVFCWIGRSEVHIRGADGAVFLGFGSIGWTRRFNVAEVSDVTIEAASWRQNNRAVYQVVLKGPDLRFGGSLTRERRDFLAAALRKQIKG